MITWPCCGLYQLASSGVSCWQGSHQEAQKFTISGLPWYWLSEMCWPGAVRASSVKPAATGAGGEPPVPEVARLTAMAATTKIATSPVMSLCLSTSRPATRPARASRPGPPGPACPGPPGPLPGVASRAAASFPMRIT